MREPIDARRVTPQADLISDLVTAETVGERPRADELVSMVGIVLVGGYEPPAPLIGNALVAMLQQPDQLAALRTDFALIPAVIEETARYDGPVTPGLSRWALEDVEIGGTTIPKGSCAMVSTASTSREPEH